MKKWFFYFYSLFLLMTLSLFGHQGHGEILPKALSENTNTLDHWIQWFGNLHLVINHFPIALVIMTVISELLFYWYGTPLFDHASRFMLYSAAILSIPTVLFGLALGDEWDYRSILAYFYWWHRFLGFLVPILAFITLYFRENHIRIPYIISLTLLFLLINITSFLGGGMAFGPEHLTPPFMHRLFSSYHYS